MTQRSDFFADFPPPPQDASVSNAIARLIDGLGFRLYWTMHGLREEDCSFRPAETAQSMGEILRHIWGLVNWIHLNIHGQQLKRAKSIIDQGWDTLVILETMRCHFIAIDDDRLATYTLDGQPFWSFINMPLSDALHHEGEVRILRHACGNPPRGLQEYLDTKHAAGQE